MSDLPHESNVYCIVKYYNINIMVNMITGYINITWSCNITDISNVDKELMMTVSTYRKIPYDNLYEIYTGPILQAHGIYLHPDVAAHVLMRHNYSLAMQMSIVINTRIINDGKMAHEDVMPRLSGLCTNVNMNLAATIKLFEEVALLRKDVNNIIQVCGISGCQEDITDRRLQRNKILAIYQGQDTYYIIKCSKDNIDTYAAICGECGYAERIYYTDSPRVEDLFTAVIQHFPADLGVVREKIINLLPNKTQFHLVAYIKSIKKSLK